MKFYYKEMISSSGEPQCVIDSNKNEVIKMCKKLIKEDDYDYQYEDDAETEVNVAQTDTSKRGILHAMYLGAELSGNGQGLILPSLSNKEQA